MNLLITYIAEKMYSDALKITIVEDNLSAHKLAALYEFLEPKRARAICDRIESKEQFIKEVQAWYQDRNQEKTTVNWQFTNHKARIKL